MAGILNVTPDSFSDGDELPDARALLARAESHLAAGAQILDVGGESTRPGHSEVAFHEELRRVVPAVRTLVNAGLEAVICVDTRRAAVAEACLAAGAHAINDVSALADPKMADTVARYGAAVVLMHGFVAPGTDVHPDACEHVDEVVAALQHARDRALASGIAADNIWLDPGLGFGKAPALELQLHVTLPALRPMGCAIYFGPSRKRFLGRVTGHERAQDRDAATAASCALAVAAGADIVRVHAPAACRDAVALAHAVRRASEGSKGSDPFRQ